VVDSGRPILRLSIIKRIAMRRSEKEIKDKTVIIDVLNRCHIGRLGTIGRRLSNG